jgi:hypothetical protein
MGVPKWSLPFKTLSLQIHLHDSGDKMLELLKY